MKKLKIVGIVIGALLLLMFIIPFLIPADTYKKLVLNEANKRLNATIEIQSMRLKIIPTPGIVIKGLKLTNKGGAFDGQTIVTANKVETSVSLIPLLSKKIIATIDLQKPELFFRTLKNGKGNFDDLIIKDDSDTEKPEEKTSFNLIRNANAEEAKSSKTSDWSVSVKGFELEDGLLEISKEGEAATKVSNLDIDLSESEFSMAVALLGSLEQNLKIKGKLDLNQKDKTLKAEKWKITLGKASGLLNADVSYDEKPSGNISLSFPETKLGNIISFYPAVYSLLPKDISKDGLNKTPFSLDLAASLKNDAATISKFKATLQSAKITAKGTLDTSKNNDAEISADLTDIKFSELKDIVPALTPLEGVKNPIVHLNISGPITNTAKLAVSGSVESKDVVFQEYEITNLKSQFSYVGNKMNLKSLTGNLYDGTLDGSGSILMSKVPEYDADVAINNIDVSKIPATKDFIFGRGTLKVAASGRGTDEASIKKNLKADGTIHLENGDIPSLKLGEKIFGNNAWNILNKAGIGPSQAALQELRQLDASCKDFNASFHVANGIITTPDVKWQHQKYRTTLSGSVSMNENLNYKGEFALNRQTTATLITNQTAYNVLANRQGELAIPFEIKGTVSKPDAGPDEKYLVQLFTRTVAALTVGKAKEIVKDVVPKDIKDTGKKVLQGIFGR